jgi:ubiquinone/menaquinone biosynthesis C-methylase UbiE
MDHRDHVFLLTKGVEKTGGVWADFGSGQGPFTLALAELLGPSGEIYSVDKNIGGLRRQERAMANRFPGLTVHYKEGDLTRPLDMPVLDGLVIANALHFFKRKEDVIELLKSYLRPNGRFIVVEYNTDRGNHWVPHPFSYKRWNETAGRIGFAHTELLATVPSSFLGEIYSAVSYKAP